MKPLKTLALTTAAILAPLGAMAAVEVGTLTCHQTDKTNLLILSEAKYSCAFTPVKGEAELFTAEANKLGVDLSSKQIERMVWHVFAPSSDSSVGALEGNFYGATADASLGIGAGAHVLVGGGDKSITLQPVSFSGIEGIGIAAGIEEFRLDMVEPQ